MNARLFTFTLTALGMLCLASCSNNASQMLATKEVAAQNAKMDVPPPNGLVVETVAMTATVRSIDAGDRTVTLMDSDGNLATYQSGKDVINFDQLRVGDKVNATATEQLALFIHKAGDPPSAAAGAVLALAPKGAKPGMVITQMGESTARVQLVDVWKHKLTVVGPLGNVRTFHVDPSVNLDGVRIGDNVTAEYAKSVAITIDTPDPLPSWNDGKAKQAIMDFVANVTREGSANFVPPAERIATFDNDGTLWAEQPLYFQFLFAIERVKVLAPEHPEWKEKEPFASLLKGDMKGVMAGGERSLIEIVMATHAGLTTDEFNKIVSDWIATAKHPVTKRPLTEMVYQPMLELLAYLRANGFKTFIVSGGGVEFMRTFAEKTYGVPPEQVIGSSGKTKFEMRDGKPVLLKLPEINFVDDKDGKPIAIQQVIGRRPVMAFGNSDGDLPMLQWTAAGPGARFCLYVHHTDAKREWAYDRESKIGTLDKGLDEAAAKGWTVMDMKDDWKTIYPPEAK